MSAKNKKLLAVLGAAAVVVIVIAAVLLGKGGQTCLLYTSEDNSRRVMEITECEILEDGTRQLHTLYRYHVSETSIQDLSLIHIFHPQHSG